jgi:hypothetical protein
MITELIHNKVYNYKVYNTYTRQLIYCILILGIEGMAATINSDSKFANDNTGSTGAAASAHHEHCDNATYSP